MTLVAVNLPARFAVLCFIGLITPFVAIVSGSVKRFALSLLLLDIPLALDIHLGHDPKLMGNPNGLCFSLTTILLVILYAVWFGEAVAIKKTKPKFFPQVSLPALCLIGTGLISVLNSRNKLFSFFEIVQLGQMFLVYFYIANHVKGEEDVELVLKVLLWGLFLEATVVLVQYLTKTQFSLMFEQVVFISGDHLFRPVGTFGHPNSTAGYLTPLLIICLGLLLSKTKFSKTKNVHNSLTWLPFGLGLVALVVTFSRGAWVAFLAATCLLVMLNMHYRWLSVPPWAMFIGIIITASLASIFGTAILYRLTHQHENALARILLMRLSLNMIKAHPLIGVGINNFGLVMKDYVTAALARAWLYIAHNRYLTVWAETGTIGFLAFLWFLLSVFREGFRSVRSARPFFSPVALGIVAGLFGYATHMMFDVFDQRSLVQLLWTLTGLVVGMGSLSARTVVGSSEQDWH